VATYAAILYWLQSAVNGHLLALWHNDNMLTKSDRAAAAEALHQAFLVNLIAEAESQLYGEGSDSEYSFS